MSEIAIRPLNPVIGGEIEGVDLSRPLTPETQKQIHEAWLDRQVIFFRDQDLTLEQHKAFGRQFAELHVHPNVPSHPEHREVLVIRADENSKGVAGQGWHTDVSCDRNPPSGSILRLTEVPASGGGDTLFASMYSAYDALSDHWQRFLSGLTAVHESAHVHGGYGVKKEDLRDGDYARAEHPVVRTHPETGRKALYVNSGFTVRIRGMKRNESRATLDFLFRHMEQPDFQCRFTWRPNSIAMWDNRCVQHLATWDYFPETRHGYRVTLCGDKPV
ncbi:MAG: TauD/TfdA family dioxygenase [Deltaproteobacteria bacterium]|nr:TauD/TfdA family dioxygenase [Deltaproteobacteria bacterium]